MSVKKPLRMIVIDSEKQELREIEVTGDTLKAMQDAVGGYIERVTTLKGGDDVFCDEEGLYKGYKNYFYIKGTHQPIAGNGVISGCAANGNTRSAKITLAELTNSVVFMDELSVALAVKRARPGQNVKPLH